VFSSPSTSPPTRPSPSHHPDSYFRLGRPPHTQVPLVTQTHHLTDLSESDTEPFDPWFSSVRYSPTHVAPYMTQKILSLFSLLCVYLMIKKWLVNNPVPTERDYKTYSVVGRNTNCSQTPWVQSPMGHVPMDTTETWHCGNNVTILTTSVSEPNIRLTVKPRPIPVDDELPFELESESKSSIYYTFDSYSDSTSVFTLSLTGGYPYKIQCGVWWETRSVWSWWVWFIIRGKERVKENTCRWKSV
jgi:hypothetical protein